MPVGWCEREGELARVDALLAAARASRGGVLLITGPAGIGKTVLLGAARERASQAGMRVLTGRGGELESGFSFGVARQLFEPLLAGAGAAERDAVLGDGAQLRHAAALAGMGLADAAAAADGLAGIRVFEPGTPLRFAHPIVRTAVHEDIPQADRGLRHAEAARLLAAEGADLDAVCAHLLVCEPPGSPEVVERLRAAAARAVVRGAPESAAAYLRRAVAETADVSLRAVLSHELGRAEKVLGDPSAAEHLREALRLTSDPAERAAVAPDLGELLVLAGQWGAGAALIREALAELADRDVQLGETSPAAVARLQAWWAGLSAYDPRLVDEFDHRLGELRAAARGVLEGGERGLRDLREAAELLEASGARLEHARALVELGAALRRANQRTAAREPLRAGLDLAYRCGATRLAERARAELLTAGARPRRRALTGLEALTACERRVAELAATGMSNSEIAQALFVTLNTVEGHLRAVLMTVVTVPLQ